MEAKSDRWPGVLARDCNGENHAVIWLPWTAKSITCREQILRSCRTGCLYYCGNHNNKHCFELKLSESNVLCIMLKLSNDL